MTARRRVESAQKVPIVINTLSSKTLERRTVLQTSDLQFHIPSLKIGFGAVFTDSPTFNVRGADQSLNTEPSTTVYVSEVPQSSRGIANAIYDLQSIAVLKGPQGVQFGRNSVGGAVLFTPQKPTNSYNGFLQQQVGNYGFFETTGAVNVPIVNDRVLFRIAGDYASRDGLIKNIGGPDAQDENHGSFRASLVVKPNDWFENYTTFDGYFANEIPEQSKLVASTHCVTNQGPIAALQKSLLACLYANAPVIQPFAPLIGLSFPFVTPPVRGGTFPGQFAATQALPNGSVNNPYPTRSQVNVFGFANTSTANLGDGLTLKNIFGYRHEDAVSYNNSAGVPAGYLLTHFLDHVEQVTEELQLQAKLLDDTLNLTTGVFYLHNGQKDPYSVTGTLTDLTPANRADLYFLTTPCAATGTCANGVQPGLKAAYTNLPFTENNSSYAIYSQVRWQPFREFAGSPSWAAPLTINAGYRYTFDDYHSVAQSYNTPTGFTFGGASPKQPYPAQSPNFYCDFLDVNGKPLGPNVNSKACSHQESGRFNLPSYQIGFDYQLAKNTLVFYSHSHSFKAGGLNPYTSVIALNTFNPEQVTADEIGIKADWELGGHAIRTNASIYQNEYKDIANQLVAFLNGTTQAATINVPTATLRGMDLEFNYRPAHIVELNGFASWEEGTYHSNIDLHGQTPLDPVKCPTHFLCTNGLPFVGLSKWTADIGATFFPPLPENIGLVTVTGDFYYRTGQYAFIQQLATNGPSDPYNRLGGFGNANLRVDWTGVYKTQLDASVFVTNLFDTRKAVFTTDNLASLGYASQNYQNPRLYGVSLRYRF